MDQTPSAIKTYSVMLFTWFLAIVPNSCEGWTSLFEMVAAFFALILVAWRFKREFSKRNKI